MQEMSKRQNQDLRADSAWRINTGKIESTFDCVTFVETNYLSAFSNNCHSSEAHKRIISQCISTRKLVSCFLTHLQPCAASIKVVRECSHWERCRKNTFCCYEKFARVDWFSQFGVTLPRTLQPVLPHYNIRTQRLFSTVCYLLTYVLPYVFSSHYDKIN